ncbi:hypothetical protein Hanom_Chr02g00130421 [Helianthus anomalus]
MRWNLKHYQNTHYRFHGYAIITSSEPKSKSMMNQPKLRVNFRFAPCGLVILTVLLQ